MPNTPVKCLTNHLCSISQDSNKNQFCVVTSNRFELNRNETIRCESIIRVSRSLICSVNCTFVDWNTWIACKSSKCIVRQQYRTHKQWMACVETIRLNDSDCEFSVNVNFQCVCYAITFFFKWMRWCWFCCCSAVSNGNHFNISTTWSTRCFHLNNLTMCTSFSLCTANTHDDDNEKKTTDGTAIDSTTD